jgi:twitching motility protein PilJ
VLGDERAMNALANGTLNLVAASANLPGQAALLSSIEQDMQQFLLRKQVVLKVTLATQALRKQSAQALEASQGVISAEGEGDAAPARIVAAGSMAMLTQRIGKSAAELAPLNGLDPDAVFLLGKDIKSFQVLLDAMIDGSPELRIKPARTANSRQRLMVLGNSFSLMKQQVDVILSNLKDFVAAREAQAKLQVELAALGENAWVACSRAK